MIEATELPVTSIDLVLHRLEGTSEAGKSQKSEVCLNSRKRLKVRKDFTITEKAPIMDFSWLKVPTSAFTFKALLRHYS